MCTANRRVNIDFGLFIFLDFPYLCGCSFFSKIKNQWIHFTKQYKKKINKENTKIQNSF